MSHEIAPQVSVVVCAHNEAKLINSCLAGLVAQSYPGHRYEVLVIDDESTDQTYEIVAGFIEDLADQERCVKLFRIKHGGLSVARNAGIQLCRGEIIVFIDGDAVPDTNWLQELVKPFVEGADYVGGRINLLNTESWVARFLQLTRHRQFFGPRLFNDECIGCNMAFRRQVFEAAGGFHENFVSRGDESTLQDRIRERFQYASAADAIVLHERPESLAAAIRVNWKSATLSYLCRKAAGRSFGWRDALVTLEQLLIAIFPFFLCFMLVSPGFFCVPFVISGMAVLRRLYLRPVNYAISVGLVETYGLIPGNVAHVLYCIVQSTVDCIGRLVSPVLHFSDEVVPPMSSKLSVLQSAETKHSHSTREAEYKAGSNHAA